MFRCRNVLHTIINDVLGPVYAWRKKSRCLRHCGRAEHIGLAVNVGQSGEQGRWSETGIYAFRRDY